MKNRTLLSIGLICSFIGLNIQEGMGQPTITQDTTCSGSQTVTGDCSVAVGASANAVGNNSIAFGQSTKSGTLIKGGAYSFGNNIVTEASSSMSIGFVVGTDSLATGSIVIGLGKDRLINNISKTLMMGMNSTVPSFYISDAGGLPGSFSDIGIATTFPLSRLHVNGAIRTGDSGTSGSLVFNHTGGNTVSFNMPASVAIQSYTLPTAGTTTSGSVLANDGTGQLLWAAPSTVSNAWLLTGNTIASTDWLGTINALDLVVKTTSIERMRVMAAGNVGIGTTTPKAQLHVVRSASNPIAKFNGSTTSSDQHITIGNINSVAGAAYEGYILGTTDESADCGLRILANVTSSDAGSQPGMLFQSYSSSGVIGTRPLFHWRNNANVQMAMNAAGNLGIGTSNPLGRLHVAGGHVYLATSASDNVGIGMTTTPSGRLHVNGTVFVTNLPGGAGAVDVGQNPLVSDQLIDLNGSKEIYKQNFEEFQFDREAFLDLSIRRFEWKEVYGGGADVGMIAEEVGQQFPELAYYGYRREYMPDGSIVSDSSGVPIQDSTQTEVRGVKYHKLSLYLFSLVKDQNTKISQLEDMLLEQSAAISACCATEPTPQLRLGSGEEKNHFTSEYVLLRNDPNPFGDHTDIRYETTDCSKCELVVTDINGRIVKRIRVTEPNGVVRIYASDIGTGVYTYSLVQDGQVLRTEKMVSTKN